jgi:hypothetical protein
VDDSSVIEPCRAFGDPVGWGAVSEVGGGDRCTCEFTETSGAAPSLLSHHTPQRRGRWIDDRLVTDRLDELAIEWLDTGGGRGTLNRSTRPTLPSWESLVT